MISVIYVKNLLQKKILPYRFGKMDHSSIVNLTLSDCTTLNTLPEQIYITINFLKQKQQQTTTDNSTKTNSHAG